MVVRIWLAFLTPVLLLELFTVGCDRQTAPTVTLAPPKVTVAHPVARELTDEDEYNGWLRASETVEVRGRVRGHIQKIHFQDGDLVQKGQLLFELDPRPFQVSIDQAVAETKAFDAQKVAAEKDVARYSQLVKSGGATQQQLEKAQADALAYDAQIAAKQEEVKRFQLDLEFSRITAPIGGRISRAMLTEGNLVNAGGSDPLLTTIVAIDPIFAYFAVDERSLQKYQRTRDADQPRPTLREQQVPFRFALDSDQGFPHEGLLDFAENQLDSGTGTIEVRGRVDNARGIYYPGSRVRVRIPFSKPYAALLVPDTAVLTDQDKKYLLVLGPNRVVLRRDVTLGRLLEDGMRVILPVGQPDQQLKPEDWVITLGLQRARLNEPVEPLDADGQPVSQPSA